MLDGVGGGHPASPEAVLTHLETVALLTAVTEAGKVLPLARITHRRVNH